MLGIEDDPKHKLEADTPRLHSRTCAPNSRPVKPTQHTYTTSRTPKITPSKERPGQPSGGAAALAKVPPSQTGNLAHPTSPVRFRGRSQKKELCSDCRKEQCFSTGARKSLAKRLAFCKQLLVRGLGLRGGSALSPPNGKPDNWEMVQNS